MFNGTQLDLIYLIGVLALLFIGTLTPVLNRQTNRLLPWNWLGMFALCRGMYDLLNLTALNQLIPGHLETVRFVLLFLSLIFLIEFGRAGTNVINRPVPWPWVYIPLGAIILLGMGLPHLTATFSFGMSAVGGGWAALALFQASPQIPKGKETLMAGGIIMFLYGIASCFPDSFESLIALAGVSTIRMVGNLLAIGLAACIFRAGQISMVSKASMMDLGAQKIFRHFAHGTAIGLLCIVAVGLVGILGINYFSNQATRKGLTENQKTAQRLQEIVNNEMEKADRLVQLLAGSSRAVSALGGSQGRRYGERYRERYGERHPEAQVVQANELLDRYSQTEEGFGVCYILDKTGLTIASSNRNQPDSFVGKNYGFRPYFKQAALGLQGRYFALGVTSKDLGYYASAPIQNEQSEIIGVAVIKRMIRTVGELKNAFDPESVSLLVDPHGIVALSNKPKYVLFSLWPLNEETKKELVSSKQFGGGPFDPILDQKPVDGKEYKLEGQRMMALTQPLLLEGWKMYHFGSTQAILFYRLMGAAAILALGLALISFYVSWEIASYKTAALAAADSPQTVDTASYGQIEEELQRGELKYRELAQNISLMSEMGDLLQACNSSRDAVPVITKYMQRLFPDLSGAIYLSSARDTLEVTGVWGEFPPEEQRFDQDDCWALRRGRQYVVEDIEAGLLCPHLSKKLPAGYQCWPLAAQGKTLGILHLRQNLLLDNPNPISAQQKEITRQLITSVVDQFTMTLINLKLQETSQVKGILNTIVR